MTDSSTHDGPHQGQRIVASGLPLDQAKSAMVLVHGRGATAESILELGSVLAGHKMALLAPQAAGNTWYPHSFLAPMEQNEPGISSGLQAIDGTIRHLGEVGITPEYVILAGFSQGACLASEYVARHARRYGGVLVFSGGLIGPPGTERSYDGTLTNTPVFLGCSDRDFHIPLERVEESAAVLADMGADVNKKIYPGMGHTIINDELQQASLIVDQVVSSCRKLARIRPDSFVLGQE